MKFQMFIAAAALLMGAQFSHASSDASKPFNCAANRNKESISDSSQANSQKRVDTIFAKTAAAQPSLEDIKGIK